MLWWGCWAPYAWLGNIVRLDRGIMPVFMFGLSATLFVMGLTAREAFVDRPGALSGPVVFAVCYIVARSGGVQLVEVGRGSAGARQRPGQLWRLPQSPSCDLTTCCSGCFYAGPEQATHSGCGSARGPTAGVRSKM